MRICTLLRCSPALTITLSLLTVCSHSGFAQTRVELHENEGRFHLTHNGQPYRIKGAGGTTYYPELAGLGGNSVRTWGTDGIAELLDDAHANGLSVCVGLWLEHERHDFDYDDPAAVRKQHERTLADVRKYKDHPAVLMWGVGNEMEGEGNQPEIWTAVNNLAKDIKRIDPHHPTITVIAELGAEESKLHNLKKYCPDVDIVGVNSYAGVSSVAERYRRADVGKPYVVTEHGPFGPWEAEKTAWDSPIEETSTEKATRYADGYRLTAVDQADVCLGTYAFLWGNKQETTATWFGMLLPDGTRLGAVDVIAAAWTGKPPANQCPQIQSLTVDRVSGLKPGSQVKATLAVTDPENDSLKIDWILRADSGTIGAGGDQEDDERTIADAVAGHGKTATITVPEDNGGYRVFAYVYDGEGGAAVANVPLLVGTAPMKPSADDPAAELPFVVYGDGSGQTVYVPSGYMGNSGAIEMDSGCKDNPHTGATCLKVSYNSGAEWGGVLWQSPAHDWDGKLPGGANLTGASRLEFWARGAVGGETVNFVYGVLDGDQPYRDTAKGEIKDARLTREWKKFAMPLDGRDLSRIKTGFGWSLAAQGSSVTFYLDDIRYVAE